MQNNVMKQIITGSSALASALVVRGWNPDMWSLFSSGEVLKGPAFVYGLFFMASAVGCVVWDHEDRALRRITLENAILKNSKAA